MQQDTSWSHHEFLPLSSATSIRLIQITRQPDAEQLCMTLVEVDLDAPDRPAYHCLSYTWGPSIPGRETSSIVGEPGEAWFVHESQTDDGRRHRTRIPITHSCREFFDEFCARNPADVHHLWVDAICINQRDLDERAAQVELMGRIYSSCDKVIAWLGEHDEASRAATRLIQKAGSNSDTHVASVYKWARKVNNSWNMIEAIHQGLGLAGEDWLSLALFMNRNWFHRKWTLQEAFLPKVLVLWCSDGLELLARDLRIAIHAAGMEHIKRSARSTSEINDPLSRRPEVHQRVLDSWYTWNYVLDTHTQRRARLGQVPGFGVNWARLRDSSDARDSIYSVLAMQETTTTWRLSVDYNRATTDVFIDIARNGRPGQFAQEIGGRAHRRTLGLPSWVPDYDSPSRPADWTTIGGNNMYSTDGDGNKDREISVLESADLRIMAVSGIMVDTIRCAGGRATEAATGKCFVDALVTLDLAPWTPVPDAEDLLESFWRTLLSNIKAQSHPDAATFGPSFSALLEFYLAKWIALAHPEGTDVALLQKTLASLSAKTKLDLLPSWKQLLQVAATISGRLDAEVPILDKNEEDNFSPYLEFFRRKFDERCFFITEHGRMGIGPDGLKTGTMVCVVKGSQYPFLLERSTTGRYEFLGLGYVRGIMFGEEVRGREFARVEIE